MTLYYYTAVAVHDCINMSDMMNQHPEAAPAAEAAAVRIPAVRILLAKVHHVIIMIDPSLAAACGTTAAAGAHESAHGCANAMQFSA